MSSKWKVGLTEYYFPARHVNVNGLDMDKENEQNTGHIMLHYTYTNWVMKCKNPFSDAKYCINSFKYWAMKNVNAIKEHPIIKNYHSIVSKGRAMELNIVAPYSTEDGTCMCVIKTFWLKCFQRKWRERHKYINKMRCLKNLNNRSIGIH